MPPAAANGWYVLWVPIGVIITIGLVAGLPGPALGHGLTRTEPEGAGGSVPILAPMTATIGAGTMRALAKVRPGPGAELVERPVPTPGEGEVLLRMEAASICGTDHHLFTWDEWASENLVPPRVLGHELAGASSQRAPG